MSVPSEYVNHFQLSGIRLASRRKNVENIRVVVGITVVNSGNFNTQMSNLNFSFHYKHSYIRDVKVEETSATDNVGRVIDWLT